VIVWHPREKRSKCSVEPLRENPAFLFVKFPSPMPVLLSNYVRIGIGGPLLSQEDADSGLLLLDGTWKLAARMEPFYTHVKVRSLPPIHTAYPRKSFVYPDPNEGLATIEALYAAMRIVGQDTTGILDHYYWKDQFLALNQWDVPKSF
jgi:pre-rRNA-processing protein TSR3